MWLYVLSCAAGYLCTRGRGVCYVAHAMGPKKAAATGDGKRQTALKGTGMDKAEADKMRSWINYNVKKGTGDVQEKAMKAQEIFSQIKSPEERKRFLHSFSADSSRNFDWLKTFEEESSNQEIHRPFGERGARSGEEEQADEHNEQGGGLV